MRLNDQFDAESLTALAGEVLTLLCAGDLDALARRYGYALSHGRDPATAIRADLRHALSEVGASSLAAAPGSPVASVKYCEPNTANLVAVIECVVPTDNHAGLLVELVVSSRGTEKHLTLEEISAHQGTCERFTVEGKRVGS